jgi:alpha-glucosidase (family GH31 glycosyl hydrolase)
LARRAKFSSFNLGCDVSSYDVEVAPDICGLGYQFLLGADVMVAPVLDKAATSVEVYFPQGAEWIDMWTGEDAGSPGKSLRLPVPLGNPAFFLYKKSVSAKEIRNYLKLAGVT